MSGCEGTSESSELPATQRRGYSLLFGLFLDDVTDFSGRDYIAPQACGASSRRCIGLLAAAGWFVGLVIWRSAQVMVERAIHVPKSGQSHEDKPARVWDDC